MRAVILAIGDELILGQNLDTNSAWLSAQLTALGIGTLYHITVADDLDVITGALVQASQSAELVLITGGLGPTDDDLTRQALAKAMGVELIVHEPSVVAIRGMFMMRGRPMPERNKLQAMHPAGSTVIPNTCGTAPGIKAVLSQATIYVTPGVPREMQEMFRLAILPEIQGRGSGGVILTAKINTFGLGESSVADRLGVLMDRTRNPKVGTTVSAGVVAVRIRSEFPTEEQARRELDETACEVEAALGPIVFSRDDLPLQHAVIALLKQHRRTLATAESCTGGLIGKMLTDVPGSSAVYVGGWITYANEMKQRELAIPAALLREHGAVSQQVAHAMAAGAREKSRADLAVAITGVAGPEGGTPEKPVGSVWVALAWPDGGDALYLNLPGDRDLIRELAAKTALQLLRFHLLGIPLDTMTWARRVPTPESRVQSRDSGRGTMDPGLPVSA